MILPCKNGSPLTMWKWYWLLRYTFFISLTWVHYCGLLLSSCRFSLFWLLGNLLLYITSYELIWPSVHTYVIFMVKALLWQVVVLCANLIINKNDNEITWYHLDLRLLTEMIQCVVIQISLGYQNENIKDGRYFFRSQLKNLCVDVY